LFRVQTGHPYSPPKLTTDTLHCVASHIKEAHCTAGHKQPTTAKHSLTAVTECPAPQPSSAATEPNTSAEACAPKTPKRKSRSQLTEHQTPKRLRTDEETSHTTQETSHTTQETPHTTGNTEFKPPAASGRSSKRRKSLENAQSPSKRVRSDPTVDDSNPETSSVEKEAASNQAPSQHLDVQLDSEQTQQEQQTESSSLDVDPKSEVRSTGPAESHPEGRNTVLLSTPAPPGPTVLLSTPAPSGPTVLLSTPARSDPNPVLLSTHEREQELGSERNAQEALICQHKTRSQQRKLWNQRRLSDTIVLKAHGSPPRLTQRRAKAHQGENKGASSAKRR